MYIGEPIVLDGLQPYSIVAPPPGMETFSEGGPTPLFGIWKLSYKPNLSHAIFQTILILE